MSAEYDRAIYDRSINQVVTETCQAYGSQPAFSCMGRMLTFAEFDQLVNQFAVYLQRHTGLQPGDRIAVQLPNVLQYPVVVMGALRAGMTVVNTNPLYTARELTHQLQDSDAKLLIVLANIAAVASEVVPNTSVEQVIVTELADLHGAPKRWLINGVVKYVKKMVPAFHFTCQVDFCRAMQLGSQAELDPVVSGPDDIAVLQYTGGTTGVAKGAVLTHRNLIANMVQIRSWLGPYLRQGREFAVAPLPLYHIYAFLFHCLIFFESGSHSLLIPNPRDIDGFVKALKGKAFTYFAGLNTLFNALCRHPDFAKLDFSQLFVTCSGGMALTHAAAEKWQQVTGCEIIEGYGLTETSPVLSFNRPDGNRFGTVGRPVPDTEIKVVDDKGMALPPGEAGELCVRGPQVMREYWHCPDETAKVLDAEGWFSTGDIAVIHEDGYFSIVDRKKDMIIVSGFNVYPNEVEDVACSHASIVEAAAIGVDDDCSGEAVKLFVVASDEQLTEQAVRDYCREHLTAYKVPRTVEFRSELPKTNVGKILRRELR